MTHSPDLTKLSPQQLVDRMWDHIIPAWLGSSAGACLAAYSVFWRLAMRPWTLVIEYSSGERVWATRVSHELFRGAIPPPIPFVDNLLPAAGVIVGVIIAVVTTAQWRAASREITRRRCGAVS